ncbi:hypothetical protein QBC46DRAFT_233757, partial [Diplogelasinospora grovesii]
LEADEGFIGGPRDKFEFVWGCLADSVKKRVITYYEEGGSMGAHDAHAFLDYLEHSFGDPHKKNKALGDLMLLKMGEKE